MICFKRLLRDLDASLTDDALRSKVQFMWVYRILMIVALLMTLVNIATDKRLLGWSTFVFALLCGADVLLARRNDRWLRISSGLFVAEILSLFTFFIVSGTPEGFSAIWICLLPSCGLLLFGRRRGTVICAAMLVIVLFFFETPWGNSFLHYPYTASFKLRFPMLYLAFYAVSLFLETVRVLTQRKLLEAQKQYRYLYAHDALTGLYNRYGFNEQMDRRFEEPCPDGIALAIVDIDHFKDVNDRYGHTSGDAVLREVAQRLNDCVGGDGAVCRWGGEEFAILLYRRQDAERIGSDICRRIRETPISAGDDGVSITVSVGIFAAEKLVHPCIGKFVHRTDQCLYRAKNEGRNRSVIEVAESF